MLGGLCPGIVPARTSGQEPRLASVEVRARAEGYLGCVRPGSSCTACLPLPLVPLSSSSPATHATGAMRSRGGGCCGRGRRRIVPCPSSFGAAAEAQCAVSVCAVCRGRHAVRTPSLSHVGSALTTLQGRPQFVNGVVRRLVSGSRRCRGSCTANEVSVPVASCEMFALTHLFTGSRRSRDDYGGCAGRVVA